MSRYRFVTLNPGHFHAALIQKAMYPGVDPRVHVYAPLSPDLAAHLGRIAGFNQRPENPTAWAVEAHASPDYLDRFRRERPGNVAVIAGRNREKIAWIEAALDAGLNVLADKPWIIEPAGLPRLEAVLDRADDAGLVAYDIMTERFEITSILQRELVRDPAVFGEPVPGAPEEPGVSMESVHHLLKLVAGAPNLRPPWFFDIREQGEALADVGTHLVDLVQWILFPEQAIDWRGDLELLAAERWPCVLEREQFQRVTGLASFPPGLAEWIHGGNLDYYCNTAVTYRIRGIHTHLRVRWEYEAAPGAGDLHTAVFRGTRARIEIRQGPEERYQPELYAVPEDPRHIREVGAALLDRIVELAQTWPGLGVENRPDEFRIVIPVEHRVGHEAHFAQVANLFFGYLENRSLLPAWEKPAMLAKYRTATEGVALSRRTAAT